MSLRAQFSGRVEDLERRDRLLGAAGVVFAALGSLSIAIGGPGWLSVACLSAALCGALAGLGLKWEHERAKGGQRSASTWRIDPCTLDRAAADGRFYEIGVEAEAPAVLDLLGHPASHVPYLQRVVDTRLRQRLEAATQRPGIDLIVLSGPSKAGKSRTLLEVAAQAAPEAFLLAPMDGAAVAALARSGPPRGIRRRAAVVWVDDLEEVTSRGDGLNVATLNAFARWEQPVVVLATHGGKGVLTADQGSREQSGDLLARYPPFELEPSMQEPELENLRERYPGPVVERIAAEGIGEFMIAAPRLIDRLRNGSSAEGKAIVRAAIDCRRAGLLRGLDGNELESIYANHLAAPPTSERFHRGLEWATEPLYSRVALLQRDGNGSYHPYDYVVGHQHHHGPPIDDETWDRVVEKLARSTEELETVAIVAYRAGDQQRAEIACRRGDEMGDPWASAHLGVLLARRGDPKGAEAAFRRGDDRGGAEGALNLGVLLNERGDEKGAEEAWRRADERGSGTGATALGRLLRRQGDLEGALVAYRRADERGDPDGALSLGWQLKDHGDLEGAEDAFRRAAERGSVEGVYHHGCMLKERGAFAEAEAVWRRADELGHPTASSNLGFLLSRRGAEKEALAAYRRADKRGDAAGAYNLGAQLEDEGDLIGAEAAFRRADERDSAEGANALGQLLGKQEKHEEAAAAFRRASERGHRDGANNLGVSLRRLGDFPGAEDAYRLAMERGSVTAITNLGTLLVERGDTDEGESLWRRADELGCEEAPAALGSIVYDNGNGDVDRAETLLRRADDRGSAMGANNLGALLWQQRHDLEGAMHAFRRSDEREGSAGAFHLAELLRYRDQEKEAMEAYARADTRGHAGGAYKVAVKFHAHGASKEALAAYGRAFERAAFAGDLDLAKRVLEGVADLGVSPRTWVEKMMKRQPRLSPEETELMSASLRDY